MTASVDKKERTKQAVLHPPAVAHNGEDDAAEDVVADLKRSGRLVVRLEKRGVRGRGQR